MEIAFVYTQEPCKSHLVLYKTIKETTYIIQENKGMLESAARNDNQQQEYGNL